MSLLRRKSAWRRAMDSVTHKDPRPLVKTGLTAVGGAIGLTAASAVISSIRHKGED